MQKLTIKLNDTFHTVGINADGLYDLKGIEKAYKATGGKGGDLRHWLVTEQVTSLVERSEIRIFKNRGKNGGTWGDQTAVILYAQYCDPMFAVTVAQAFVALVNGETEQATKIAMTVAKVHDQMAMERPRQQIRKLYKESGLSIDAFTERYLKLMDNNRQADMGDRIRTSDSLKTLVDESYDSLSARELSAASQHERALRLITEYQKERLTWSLSNQAKKERKRLDALKPVIKDGVETIISNRVQKAVADKAPF